ncbi:MAG: universal stress protein [Paludibacter sp.]
MVLVFIQHIETAQVLINSAAVLAKSLQKQFGVLIIVPNEELISANESELNEFMKPLNLLSETQINVLCGKINQLAEICDELDASFLFLQLTDSKSKSIRGLLDVCRDLRIPYVLFKDTFRALDLKKVILPIGFLEEELEKAQFASAFGRFCNSEIKMLLANDYGSKAATNAEKMQTLFDKFELNYTLEKATKDSFKVERESIQVAEKKGAGLIIVSASREYGLDDILFGPKEFHVVKKSPIPVLLVNPRGDLYALCD